jgi:predicted CoA-binding protein
VRLPTVAVLGASTNRAKFGNKAVRAYAQKGYEVYPVNPRAEFIEGYRCYPSIEAVPGLIDRVTVYLPPEIGLQVIESIAARQPKEIWLNPGAESEALIRKAESLGLVVRVGCSIVDLGVDPRSLPD